MPPGCPGHKPFVPVGRPPQPVVKMGQGELQRISGLELEKNGEQGDRVRPARAGDKNLVFPIQKSEPVDGPLNFKRKDETAPLGLARPSPPGASPGHGESAASNEPAASPQSLTRLLFHACSRPLFFLKDDGRERYFDLTADSSLIFR
jgi:hypothetical protein